jgi:hypothetical protein
VDGKAGVTPQRAQVSDDVPVGVASHAKARLVTLSELVVLANLHVDRSSSTEPLVTGLLVESLPQIAHL